MAMFRFSLARLMGVVFVVAITLAAVRFLGPAGLSVAACAFVGSLVPVLVSKRRGLDPTVEIFAVACGALGSMIGGTLAGENIFRNRPLFVGLRAFLGGVYWLAAVWVRLSPQRRLGFAAIIG
jgi:hypothetical protein